MRSKINLHKNLIFLGVVSLGALYSVLLSALIFKFAQNCALEWQILLLQWSNPFDQNNMDATARFIAGFTAISFMVYSLISLLKIILGVLKTSQLKSKISVRAEGLNIIQNSTGDVFTAGFLRPEIYISQDLIERLSSEELDIILMHEREHVKYSDNLMLMIVNIALAILPPIPGKSGVLDYYKFLIEINADIPAIEKYGKKSFFKTVDKIIQNKNSQLAFIGFAHDYQRINYHLNKVKWFSVKTVGMMVGYFILAFTMIGLVNSVRAANRCQQVTDCINESSNNGMNSCDLDNLVRQSRINQSNNFQSK